MIDPGGFAKVELSSADLPEENRVAVWREHYGRRVLKVDIEPMRDAPFHATVMSRAFPGLHLMSGEVSPVRISRPREFLADGNDDLALVINRAGAIAATAPGCELALGPGDAVLISSSATTAFERSSSGRSFSIRIPRPVLSALIVDVDRAAMRPVPCGTGALRLLTSYAEPLLDEDELATPDVVRLAVSHVHDLVALTLGATREAAETARDRGVRAARLRSAKIHIAGHCNDPALSVVTVARHLGVTPRYLQRLFETDGGTFTEFLRSQRLARAHRLLTNPAFVHRQVSAIAYEVGFNDLSYFNRCFRQRYGATPRDVRVAAAN